MTFNSISAGNLLRIIIFYLLAAKLLSNCVWAQQNIIPAHQTITTVSNQFIDITGGFRKGANLYHDFQHFSLMKSDVANFLNDDPNAPLHTNIITRITGSPSNIDGEIRSTNFESASLFFFNPKGIAFGPNAKLSIPGSLHVSTGDYIEFGNGEKYFADDSNSMNLLTLAPPVDFGFINTNGAKASRIRIEGSNLSVPEGEKIRIVGGEIRVVDATLTADKGKIELLSKKESGIFLGNDAPGNGVKIFTDELSLAGQVSILHVDSGTNNFVDPVIDINVETLTLKKGAEISSATSSGFTPGNINIRAAKSIELEGSRTLTLLGSIRRDIPSRINTSTSSPNSVAGNITLITPDLTISNKGQVVATSAGLGKDGSGGNINLAIDQLKIRNKGKISSNASGDGKGGEIRIGQKIEGAGIRGEAELVSIDGKDSAILSNTMGKGRGGNIEIDAKKTELLNGGSISAVSVGPASGSSGDITITASDTVRLINGSEITVETDGADAGNINLQTKKLLHLSAGSKVTTSAGNGEGNGGNINIDPIFVVLDGGSQIIANARQGAAGDIDIVSEFLFQSEDSLIQASNDQNISGEITITATEADVVSDTQLLTDAFQDVSATIGSPCADRISGETSSFVVRPGRQGLAHSPDNLLAANMVATDYRKTHTYSKGKRIIKVPVFSDQGLAVASVDCAP